MGAAPSQCSGSLLDSCPWGPGEWNPGHPRTQEKILLEAQSASLQSQRFLVFASYSCWFSVPDRAGGDGNQFPQNTKTSLKTRACPSRSSITHSRQQVAQPGWRGKEEATGRGTLMGGFQGQCGSPRTPTPGTREWSEDQRWGRREPKVCACGSRASGRRQAQVPRHPAGRLPTWQQRPAGYESPALRLRRWKSRRDGGGGWTVRRLGLSPLGVTPEHCCTPAQKGTVMGTCLARG